MTNGILGLLMAVSMAAAPDTTQSQRCPAGYEYHSRPDPGLCVEPLRLTFRGIEACSQRDATLVVDYLADEDRCIRASDSLVLTPRCADSFSLETKPGKDRCRRLEPRRSAPPFEPTERS